MCISKHSTSTRLNCRAVCAGVNCTNNEVIAEAILSTRFVPADHVFWQGGHTRQTSFPGADGDYRDFSAFWALALTFSKCQLPFSNYMYAPHQREVKCDASMNETRVILQCQERQGSVDYDRRPRGPRAETLGQHLWLIRHSKLHKQSS